MRSGPTLISSMFGHEIHVLVAQRFHEQHLRVFQSLVTFSSWSESNFVGKRTFLSSSDAFTKAGRSYGGKTENTAVFFRSLVVFTLLYSHSQPRFSHITPFLIKTSIVLREQRGISTTLFEGSAPEEHKQENVAYHTRATCVHPTINKQPSMYCLLSVLITTDHFKPVHMCIFAHLLSLTFDKCWQEDLYSDEGAKLQATDHVIDHANTNNTPHIALQECV